MKIKDTLDLCGWELWNFCIQNHQNLEGLLDLGAGRKVFYTGNDQGKNGREVIYDGSKWKVSAYISDVDELRGLITALESATDEEIEALKGRATTLEGRVDTIDNMLNVENSQTVVDTWEEVKKFLASVSEETDLITLLNGKANAGIESGKGYVALPYANNKQAFIFYNGGFEWSLTNEGWTGSYRILHAGNFASLIGDTYLKTTGGTINGNLQIGTNDNTQFNHLTIVRSGKAIRLNGYGTGMGLSFGSFSSGGTFTQEYQISMSNYGLQYKESDKTYSILHVGNYSDLISEFNLNLTLYGQLKINNANPSIQFANGDVTYGRLAWNPNSGLVMTDSSWNKEYILLRSDNYSDLITTLNKNVTFNAELIGKTETGGSFARWRIATSGNGTFFQAGSVDSTKVQGILYLSGINGTYLEKLNILSDLAVVSNKLHIGHIANDDGSALQINGDIHVTGNIIADGEVSAGGAATEGNGGAGGFSLYESWGTSAPTEPLALGANLGYELKTRVEDLELAKTKVEISDTLVSGKPIGAITIDGNTTNLLAPATYAWSEITGTEKVLTTAGGTISGDLTIKKENGESTLILGTNGCVIYNPTSDKISLFNGGSGYPALSVQAGLGHPVFRYNYADYTILHSGNYSEYALPKTGGKLKGLNPYHQYILTLDTDNVYYTILSLKSQGVRKGDFRWTSDDTTIVGVSIYNATTKDALGLSDDGLPMYNKYILLHSGNFADYAVKYDNGASIDAARHSIGYDNGTRGSENFPIAAGGGGYISFGHDSYGGQLIGQSNGLALYYRGVENNVFSAWKQIAFADGSNASGTWDITSQRSLLLYQPKDGAQVEDVMTGQVLRGLRFVHTVPRDIEGMFPATNYANAMLVINRHSGGGSSQLGFSGNGNIYYRLMSDTDWKTIAFTDSDITGNAIGLKGADGNVSATAVNGNLSLVGRIYWGDLDWYYISKYTETSGVPPFGKYKFYSGHIFECAAGQAMRINSSGNVTIGASDLAGTSAKLYVDGTTVTSGNLVCKIDDVSTAFFGTAQGGYGDGKKEGALMLAHSGSLYFGSTSKVFAQINPYGNVTIGASDLAGSDYKLYVGGRVGAELYHFARNKANYGYIGLASSGNNDIYISTDSTSKLWLGGNGNIIMNYYGGNVLIGTTEDNGAKLQVNGTSAFYGSTVFGKENLTMQVNFKCPVVAEDRVTIGGATLRWDEEIKALRLNTSLAATGEVSAGGAGTEGGNTGGGGTGTIASPFSRTFTPNEKTSFTFSHDLPYYDVVVQVYEWDSSGMCWNMVLADIEIQNNDVTVTLGRMENVEHKIVVR